MTDHLSWETLNDLVDGMLSPSVTSAAEAHVLECELCAASLAGLRATVSAAGGLPTTMNPPEDLWTDVRATIEAGKVAHLPPGADRVPSRGWWVTPRRLAAAAVVLVAATAALTSTVISARSPDETLAQSTTMTMSVSWQASERVFQASVLELREQLEALHEHLSPGTLVKVERALATIDLAIAEGREALLRDPANTALSELVASNYRQKIELLRRVTQLASS